jgi:Tfp pilus assembly protein PilF
VAGATPWRYLVTQAEGVATYLRLLAWPAGLSVDWAWPASPGLSHPATLASAALLALALAGAAALLARGRRGAGPGAAAARLAGVGVLWYFVALAPTSSLVPLADNLVEHRTYLANWGALLAVVAGADWLADRLGRPRLAAGAWAAAVLALALALAARTADWRTREALWRDAAARNPGSMRAHLNLGEALAEQGRAEEAAAEHREALRVTDGVPRHEAVAFLDLGVALLDAGRPAEARAALEAGLQRDPGHDLLLVNLAALEGAAGNLAAAEALARRAQAANPGQASVQVLFGHLAMERGDAAGALDAFARALALDPERGEARYGRALVLSALERPAEACAELRAALATPLRPALRADVSGLLQARCR